MIFSYVRLGAGTTGRGAPRAAVTLRIGSLASQGILMIYHTVSEGFRDTHDTRFLLTKKIQHCTVDVVVIWYLVWLLIWYLV